MVVALMIVPGVTVSMLSNVVLLFPFVSPMVLSPTTLALTVSVMSASERVSVPELVRPASTSLRVAVSELPAPTVMRGNSLVPVRVTATVVVVAAAASAPEAPLLSVSVRV